MDDPLIAKRRPRGAAGRGRAAVVVGLMLVGLSVPLSARARCAGVELPARLEAFGLKLLRNGVGLREATFLNVDVYVAGLYVSHPSRSARALLRQDQPKAVLLRFVRDVSRDEMIDAMNEALKDNVGSEYGLVQQHMSRFVKRLPELRNGTHLMLSYRPGHGIELRVNGKSLGVDDDDHFGNLVFRAWLGPKPPDEDLKRGMLGGPCE